MKNKSLRTRDQKRKPLLADEKTKKIAIGTIMALFVLIAVAISFGANGRPDVNTSRQVTIETSRGNIVLDIYPKLMPVTTDNFAKLVKSGFYNGLTFHRVEDWVIQGGDPQGNGRGGPGWTIPLETNPELKNVRGAVAMARGEDPNSAGSQFYILKKDAPWLDGQYAVFGKVVQGMEVVDKIKVGDKMLSVKER